MLIQDPFLLIQIPPGMTSNLSTKGKCVLVKLSYPFELLAERPAFSSGRAKGDTVRTVSAWIKQILFEVIPGGNEGWLKSASNFDSPFRKHWRRKLF